MEERAKVRQEKRNHAKVAALIHEEKQRQKTTLDEQNEMDAKIAALPKPFGAAELGAKSIAGNEAREGCLEKLKLRSPKLSLGDEVKWQKTKE